MTSRGTVVLLHGVGLDHTLWAPVRVALEAEGSTVVTPDLPGHGDAAPVAEGVTLANLAARVAEVVPPGSHVVGFSLGALVAQHLARFRTDLVASLVSVSSVCRRTPAERDAVLARLVTAEADFPASVAASLQRWFPGESDTDLVRHTERTLLANDVESYLRCYRVFATADAELSEELPRITVPALAVTGDLDPGSTPEMTRRLADAVPGSRAVVVPGARHLWPAQHPDVFVSHLVPFLEGVSR